MKICISSSTSLFSPAAVASALRSCFVLRACSCCWTESRVALKRKRNHFCSTYLGPFPYPCLPRSPTWAQGTLPGCPGTCQVPTQQVFAACAPLRIRYFAADRQRRLLLRPLGAGTNMALVTRHRPCRLASHRRPKPSSRTLH
jgi:hypothetical protein